MPGAAVVAMIADMATREELTARAVRAAVAVARRHGVASDDPVVLSDRGNALVRLRPAPVVARVATSTAFTRRDPAAWLAREVRVARAVADARGPVVAPSDVLDPGPHGEDGLALTFWTHVEVSSRRPTPVEVGAALAEFHVAAASAAGPAAAPGSRGSSGPHGSPGVDGLPVLTPVRDQIAEALDALDGPPAGAAHAVVARIADVAALRREHESVLAAIEAVIDAGAGPHGVLHGDAHPGNLVHADGRWRWLDLEETCRGPLAWDLAVLSRTTALDGAAAVRAYAAVTGTDVPDLAPWARARSLEGAAWALGMAAQDPDRYAIVAADLVARIAER